MNGWLFYVLKAVFFKIVRKYFVVLRLDFLIVPNAPYYFKIFTVAYAM